MTELQLCIAVANAINQERGWTKPEDVGVLPDAVYQVIHGQATASHPMTQKIIAEIRRVKENPRHYEKPRPKRTGKNSASSKHKVVAKPRNRRSNRKK